MPTATPSYYPCPSGGLREAGGGSLLNVAPYFQFRCQRLYIESGRRRLPCSSVVTVLTSEHAPSTVPVPVLCSHMCIVHD